MIDPFCKELCDQTCLWLFCVVKELTNDFQCSILFLNLYIER